MRLVKKTSNDILFTIIGFGFLASVTAHPYFVAGSVVSFVLAGWYGFNPEENPKDLAKTDGYYEV